MRAWLLSREHRKETPAMVDWGRAAGCCRVQLVCLLLLPVPGQGEDLKQGTDQGSRRRNKEKVRNQLTTFLLGESKSRC